MRNILAAAVIGLTALTAVCGPASATVIPVPPVTSQFDFTGLCRDCTGYGDGVLTVQNYTPGTAFTDSEFVDFKYTSNLFPASSPFEITAADLTYFSGIIGVTPGEYNVTIFNTGFTEQFISFNFGHWCLGGNCANDDGPSHVWAAATTAVPEPFTLSLFGAGLFAAGALRRRRNKKSKEA